MTVRTFSWRRTGPAWGDARVIGRDKQKAEAGLVEHLAGEMRRTIEPGADRFENVGGSALGG